jgi:hypothetical protein
LNTLIQNLSFFVFPLFFIFNRRSIYFTTLNTSLKFFIASNLFIAIYVWCKILNIGLFKILKEDNYYNPLIRNIFNDTSEIHLPYLGMLFVFSSLVMLQNVLKKKITNKIIILNLIGIIILLFSVFLFAARMALLLFFIIATIMFFNQKIVKNKIIYFCCTLILVLPLFFLPTIKNRIKEFTSIKLILPQKSQTSAEVNFRYGIYNCTWELLKENWLLGVGPFNVQNKLNNCYSSYTYENEHDDFKHKAHNTHNQYADVILKYGVLGISLFFIFLFWGIKNKKPLYIVFLSIILISMLTENILDRQIGIVFFNFFNTLFFINHIDIETNRKKIIA